MFLGVQPQVPQTRAPICTKIQNPCTWERERERERERAGEQWLVGDAKADRRVAAKAHHSGKTVLVALWRAERKWAPNGSERGEEGDSDDHLAILALATGWCRSEGPETKKENR